ncbi:MAG: metal-sensitive transcriptional regulator [bacterium]|nr:metal-sensitive transcriptional regulator [bacterium]
MKAEIKKQTQNRLKRIEGQVRGLQKMIDGEEYCIDIITQSSAIRSALGAVEDLLLENHLEQHVVAQMKGNQEKRALEEIMAVFKRSKKR